MTPTKRKPKPVPVVEPEYPKSFEVIGNPQYGLSQLRQHNEPSCFNGIMRLTRYRITVEEVAETIEETRVRFIQLWRNDEPNHHHWAVFREWAKKLGLDFENDMGGIKAHGCDRPKVKR